MEKSYKTYIKELITLALPIIMGHIGFTFIVAGDVFVAGKYSTDALAAVSISGAVTSLVFMFGIGLIISVSPVLSNKLGAKKSVKKFFCEIIDDRYKLNETIFEKLAEMYAVNDIAFECYQNKDFTDYHERIEKRTAEYKYKAWNDELKAIKECASNGENRIEKINGGV